MVFWESSGGCGCTGVTFQHSVRQAVTKVREAYLEEKKGFLSDSVHTSHPWTSGSTWGKFYLSVWQYQKLKSKTGRMGLDAPSFLTMSQKPIFSSEGLSYCCSCCCKWSNWEADWVTDPSGATMGHWTPPGHYAFTYHIEQWPVKRYLQLVLPCHPVLACEWIAHRRFFCYFRATPPILTIYLIETMKSRFCNIYLCRCLTRRKP